MRTVPCPDSVKEIFLRRIPLDDPYGCWVWMGTLSHYGYGVIAEPGTKRKFLAHRVAYEALVGPIPEGLVVDHLCEVRYCVNPAHFQIVLSAVNSKRGQGLCARRARQSECLRGHPLSGSNLYLRCDGRRICRICRSDREQTARERKATL